MLNTSGSSWLQQLSRELSRHYVS